MVFGLSWSSEVCVAAIEDQPQRHVLIPGAVPALLAPLGRSPAFPSG